MKNEKPVITKELPRGLLFMLAASCGLIVANLYYAQTLVGPISAATGLSAAAAGLIVTLTQIGYVLGLLFIVPLSDIVENRRLTVAGLLVAAAALLAAASAPGGATLLGASLLIGAGSVVAQILVPYASYLASEEQRGRVVGNVMSGLLLGIMLARPAASLLSSVWGWRTVFALSAAIIILLAILLAILLPRRQPAPSVGYRRLIGSMAGLIRTTPLLRRRAIYQASLFGAFSLFWTVAPMWLADGFGMTQRGIALFALAGVGGAAAAPIAGRLADRGLTRPMTAFAFAIAIVSLGAVFIVRDGSTTALVLLYISAVTLDMAVSGNLVLGQRAIYSLGQEARGRLNGLFMSMFFIGGAAGSSLGGWAYAQGGWGLASGLGLLLPLLGLLYFLTERTGSQTDSQKEAQIIP